MATGNILSITRNGPEWQKQIFSSDIPDPRTDPRKSRRHGKGRHGEGFTIKTKMTCLPKRKRDDNRLLVEKTCSHKSAILQIKRSVPWKQSFRPITPWNPSPRITRSF